jgi:RHS repeat-associated protein
MVYIGGIYEKNLDTGEVTKHYMADGRRIAMRKGSNLFYFANDHLGSTSLVMDGAPPGNMVSQTRYYPYGNVWTQGVSATPQTDKLFTGQRRYGANSGIYHYGARFYSADIGRFLQPDTIVPGAENPQALNRYSYVLDNPLTHSDPTGHCVPDVNCPGDECFRNPACGQPAGPTGGAGGGGGHRSSGSSGGTIGGGGGGSGHTAEPHGRKYVSITPPRPKQAGWIADCCDEPGGLSGDHCVDFIDECFGFPSGKGVGGGRRGGGGPVRQGQAGVAMSEADIIEQGGTVLGNNITLETLDGVRFVPDIAYELNGRIYFRESKNGRFTQLSTNQAKGYSELSSSQVIPRGQNAMGAGFEPGVPIGPYPVQIDLWGIGTDISVHYQFGGGW